MPLSRRGVWKRRFTSPKTRREPSVVSARELGAETGFVVAQVRKIMDLQLILLIVVVLLLFGGGGFYWSRRGW